MLLNAVIKCYLSSSPALPTAMMIALVERGKGKCVTLQSYFGIVPRVSARVAVVMTVMNILDQ